ncbi:MAG: NTP transferase domain-containing protein [Magnetococcales bacterium]|nr:NTP transferase domain-containing protein [Magnetococcales bacterium]
MHGIILTAGRVEDSMAQLFGEIATGLVPVQGRPILFYIINHFLKLHIQEIHVAVGYGAETVREVLDGYFASKTALHYVDVDPQKGPGDSLLTVLQGIGHGKVVVVLADTWVDLAQESLVMEDVVVASADFNDPKKWCTVEVDGAGRVMALHDKCPVEAPVHALVGVYILSEIRLFADFSSCKARLEIADLLRFYQSRRPLSVLMTDQWLDFGHFEKYQTSKKRLLEARHFNSLEFNDLLGTITKRSQRVEKFCDEVRWQLDLPKNLQVLFPRIIDYELSGTAPFVTMEYFGYQTVAEIWLYANFRPNVLEKIIAKLWQVALLFRQELRPVTPECYQTIYIHKTESRLAALLEHSPLFRRLFAEPVVLINGQRVHNWSTLRPRVFAQVPSLYRVADNCLIHGDYCFSNILFDINNGIVRLLDPRGGWGGQAFGDFKYDLAKLRHSIHGDYDFIVNDLVQVTYTEGEPPRIRYRIFKAPHLQAVSRYFDGLIAQQFDVKEIQLIEGLLFLSMLPLHANDEQRQLVMYAKALEILNEAVA